MSKNLTPVVIGTVGAGYAVAPFIGTLLSLLIFHELPGILFTAALILMLIGAWLSSQDKPLNDVFKIKNELIRKLLIACNNK